MQESAEENRGKEIRKDWELFRNVIIHEDALVNNRLSWLLTIEAFLLAGVFISGIENPATSMAMHLLAVGIFLIASVISLAGLLSIASAHDRVTAIIKLWYKKYHEERDDATRLLPPLTGKSPFRGEYDDAIDGGAFRDNVFKAMWCSPLLCIPALLVIVNIAVMIGVISHIWQEPT